VNRKRKKTFYIYMQWFFAPPVLLRCFRLVTHNSKPTSSKEESYFSRCARASCGRRPRVMREQSYADNDVADAKSWKWRGFVCVIERCRIGSRYNYTSVTEVASRSYFWYTSLYSGGCHRRL